MRTLTFVVLLLCACGPQRPELDGKWTGSLATVQKCTSPDGGTTTQAQVTAVSWLVSESNESVSVITLGPCGRVTGSRLGDGFVLKTCAPDSVGDVVVGSTFVRGAGRCSSAEPDVLHLEAFVVNHLRGTVACTDTSSGDLGREP